MLAETSKSYIDWLKHFTVDNSQEPFRKFSHNKLLMILWEVPYKPFIGNDIDRRDDGLDLRYEYNRDIGNNYGLTNIPNSIDDIYGPCRTLEMLIALTFRICEIMDGSGLYNDPSRWFWEIISNVGLLECTDAYFDKHPNCNEVIEELICNLNYPKGNTNNRPGGWFNIGGWNKMELWYQMHSYLLRYLYDD